jgi:hypothetical protein
MVVHMGVIEQIWLQIYPLPMPISVIRHWVGLNGGTHRCYKAVLASNLSSPQAYLSHQTPELVSILAHLCAIKQFRLQIYPLPMPISVIRRWVSLNGGTHGCYKAVLASNLPPPHAYLSHQTQSWSQYWHTAALKAVLACLLPSPHAYLCHQIPSGSQSMVAHLGAIKQFWLQLYPLPMPISVIRRLVGLNGGTHGCYKAVIASNLPSPHAYLCHQTLSESQYWHTVALKAVLAWNPPSPHAYLCHQMLSGSQWWHTWVL